MTKLECSIFRHVLSNSGYLISIVMSGNICMFYEVNSIHGFRIIYNVFQIFLLINLNLMHQWQNFHMKNIWVINITMEAMHKFSIRVSYYSTKACHPRVSLSIVIHIKNMLTWLPFFQEIRQGWLLVISLCIPLKVWVIALFFLQRSHEIHIVIINFFPYLSHQMTHMAMGVTIPSLSMLSQNHMKIKLSSPIKPNVGPIIKFHIACAWLQLNK